MDQHEQGLPTGEPGDEPERIAERKTETLASPSVNSSIAEPEPMSHRRAHCSRGSTQYNVNSGRSSSGGEGTALVATDPTSSQAASTTGVGSTCCCRLHVFLLDSHHRILHAFSLVH